MRILGIDVGSSSIKAVELDSAFGRYEIHDYYEHPVEPGADMVLALARLMQALPRQPDRVAIALKSGQVTFRNLKLPTRDRKSIQAGVGFELEDELPFALEKAVYDYSILSQGKQGTNIHVAATLKGNLSGTIEAWASAGIGPDLITTESWAYRTLLSRVLNRAQQEEPVILAQIGHEHTTLYAHWNGMPVLAREVSWGGKDLTQAIAQKYGLSTEQAEQAKLDHGFVIPVTSVGQRTDITPEQAEFSETLLASIQSLLVEIRQVELTCKSATHRAVGRIYLAGGTSLLPGLAGVLQDGLHIPVQPLQALSSIATSGVTYSEHTDAVFPLAASVALCMVGVDKVPNINFRKGEFSKLGRQRELNIATLRRPILAASAITGCMLLSLGVQSSVYSAKLKEMDVQLERSMKGVFGSISSSGIRTYLSNPTGLRNAINKELTQQRDIAKLSAPNPQSPLDFLNAISSSIPKSVVTDMMQFHVGAAPATPYATDAPQSASLVFYVANPQMAEQLTSSLNGRLAGLKREKLEEVSAADGSKQWKVTFTGKPLSGGP